MNKYLLSGKLGHDVRVITTSQDAKEGFLSFSVCDSTNKDKPFWVECTQSFKNGVPAVANYLKKGTGVLLDGIPYPRARKNKDGQLVIDQKGNPTLDQCIYVNRLEIISWPKAGEAVQPGTQAPEPEATVSATPDDLPF